MSHYPHLSQTFDFPRSSFGTTQISNTQMEAFLTTKNLWDIVNGMEVRPAGSDNTKAVKSWQKKQRLAQAGRDNASR